MTSSTTWILAYNIEATAFDCPNHNRPNCTNLHNFSHCTSMPCCSEQNVRWLHFHQLFYTKWRNLVLVKDKSFFFHYFTKTKVAFLSLLSFWLQSEKYWHSSHSKVCFKCTPFRNKTHPRRRHHLLKPARLFVLSHLAEYQVSNKQNVCCCSSRPWTSSSFNTLPQSISFRNLARLLPLNVSCWNSHTSRR